MGVDLMRYNESMSYNWHGWRHVLKTAVKYGWKPAGTVNEIDEAGQPILDWDGTYFSNDYQYVTVEDAKNLAEALERAISEFDDKEYLYHILPFIKFCRRGGFRLF